MSKKRQHGSDKTLVHYTKYWDDYYATDEFVMDFKKAVLETYELSKKGPSIQQPLEFIIRQFDEVLRQSGRQNKELYTEPREKDPKFEIAMMQDYWSYRYLQQEATLYELRDMLTRTMETFKEGRKKKKGVTSS